MLGFSLAMVVVAVMVGADDSIFDRDDESLASISCRGQYMWINLLLPRNCSGSDLLRCGPS